MINLSKGLNLKDVSLSAEKYHKKKRTRQVISFLFSIILMLSLTFNVFAENIQTEDQQLELTNLRCEVVTILSVNEGYIFTSNSWAISINDIYLTTDLTVGKQLMITYYANDINNPLDDEFITCWSYPYVSIYNY